MRWLLMKVVTICGSLKFINEMMVEARNLSFSGNCVLTPIYPVGDDVNVSKEQINLLKNEHFKKIELSDFIYVLDKDGYIGDSTKLEIEYAASLGKDIVYYSDGDAYE